MTVSAAAQMPTTASVERALVLAEDAATTAALVAELLRRAIAAASGSVRTAAGRRRSDVAAAFDEAEAALAGEVDGLVCIAPSLDGTDLAALDYATWRTELGSSIDTAFFATQELGGRLAANGRSGAILHVCPVVAGADSVQRETIHAAVVGLAKASAAELAPHVRVNAVIPPQTGVDAAAVRAMAWLLCDASYCMGSVLDLGMPSSAAGLRW